jgi:hypothetical protein
MLKDKIKINKKKIQENQKKKITLLKWIVFYEVVHIKSTTFFSILLKPNVKKQN